LRPTDLSILIKERKNERRVMFPKNLKRQTQSFEENEKSKKRKGKGEKPDSLSSRKKRRMTHE
jgi:hypothetical protein